MLTDFIDDNCMDIQWMVEKDRPFLQTVIDSHCKDNKVGQSLFDIATKLEEHRQCVPFTKEGLMAVKVNEMVASLLLQQVFGETELVVGLHARKVVCALDLVDWEESGATLKQNIKMVNMPAE